MAHETGHYLGVADHYTVARKVDLMYGITDQRGINLRKSNVNTMNP
jgi:predicted Zn-dependent protease